MDSQVRQTAPQIPNVVLSCTIERMISDNSFGRSDIGNAEWTTIENKVYFRVT
jgi:hypothetical protein